MLPDQDDNHFGTIFLRAIMCKKASVVGTVLKQTGIMCTTSEKVNFINIFDLTNTQLIFTNILQYL